MRATTGDGRIVVVRGLKADALRALVRLDEEWRTMRRGRRRRGCRRVSSRQVAREIDRARGVPWPKGGPVRAAGRRSVSWEDGTDDEREAWKADRTPTRNVSRALARLEEAGVVAREGSGQKVWVVVEIRRREAAREAKARHWYVYGGSNHGST